MMRAAQCIIGTLALLLTIGVQGQQYYFRGRFADSTGQGIAFVQMRALNGTLPYQSGSSGEFGIPSALRSDSVTCYLQGYDSVTVLMHHNSFNEIVLRPNRQKLEEKQRDRRVSSLAISAKPSNEEADDAGNQTGESYHQLVVNPFVNTSQYPATGFVPNSNRASYSNIRRFVENHTRVPANAVRIEELWNYFQPKLAPDPVAGQAFALASHLAPSPWSPGSYLLMLNAIAGKVNISELPPANLVFLIDNSGSMEPANRLPLLKAGFKMMVNNMRPVDRVAIVTYGGAAGIMLKPTYGTHKQAIIDVIDSLEAGGATPGSNGIQLAYELATTNSMANGINRVILATDGDFNIGLISERDLEDLVSRYKNSGVSLSCLGVGMGNYKDSKIEVLARLGNGNFAYLDTEEEAQKVLVQEVTQNLYATAKDVRFHMSFDPAVVSRYRLIGYDNRIEAVAGKNSELVGNDAGSGQSIVAMIELELTPKARFQDGWGSWQINYRLPADTGRQLSMRQTLPSPTDSIAPNAYQLATSLAWLGLQLRQPPTEAKAMHWPQIEQMALQVADSSQLMLGYLKLLQKTRQLYEPPVLPKKDWKPRSRNSKEN